MRGLQLVVVGLILAGCSATRLYDGPRLPAAEVVRIEGMNSFNPINGFYGTWVVRFDGEAVDATDIEFLPGSHEIELMWGSFGRDGDSKVHKGMFRAGERYVIGITFSGAERYPSLINMTPYPDEE